MTRDSLVQNVDMGLDGPGGCVAAQQAHMATGRTVLRPSPYAGSDRH